MTLIIEQSTPDAPQTTALLKASHTLMQSLFPAEDNHFLSIEALAAPNIHFFVAREGATTLGCGALAQKKQYGEVKSMFVDPKARGKGVADALLRQLIDLASSLHLPAIKLETGGTLHAAHRLYARHGFTECSAFGDYPKNETSIFMEKHL